MKKYLIFPKFQEPKCVAACEVGGKFYADGDKIPNIDPCKDCVCLKGEEKCAIKDCARPPPGCKAIPVEGQCCPDHKCGCERDGVNYPEGASLPQKRACEDCSCQNGQIRCEGPSACEATPPGCTRLPAIGLCCPGFACGCEKDGVFYPVGSSKPVCTPPPPGCFYVPTKEGQCCSAYGC